MLRSLAALPFMWSSIIAAMPTTSASSPQVVTDETGISLGLFVAGIIGTVTVVWWARGDRDQVERRIRRLEERIRGQENREDVGRLEERVRVQENRKDVT